MEQGWPILTSVPALSSLFQRIPKSLCLSFLSTSRHCWLLTFLEKEPLQFISSQLLVAFPEVFTFQEETLEVYLTSKLQKNESLMVEGQASVTDWWEHDL